VSKEAELKVDRTGWAEGPWSSEPDRIEWRHQGFPCLMLRHRSMGHWCGYVAVPKGHPWYGRDDMSAYELGPDGHVDYDKPLTQIDVHGGITYGRKCDGHVCHVPQPGEADDVHWLGFDCAHSGDMSPSATKFAGSICEPAPYEKYRDAAYVRAEVESLAKQAAAASRP